MNKQLSEKDMFDFGAPSDFCAAVQNKPMYACDVECGEIFDRADIWHCPICHHHWQPHRDSCWNCHNYYPAKHANLAQAYKEYMRALRAIDPHFGMEKWNRRRA